MSPEKDSSARTARVIVVGNEKGGSGKSTVAMHIAMALVKAGHRVATVDLDTRQKSLTSYIENRRAWAGRTGRDLETPSHHIIEPGEDSAMCARLSDIADALGGFDFVVIDTPGHDSDLTRLAHTMADTLVTPLNDSFVDFDLLGTVDPETFAVSGISQYAQMVDDVRRQRQERDGVAVDWIVIRNRLSMLGTRNKRLVGEALSELSRRLGFRSIDGFAERMIFREFFPRGLTALDDLDQATLGTRPTLSHATARSEVASLIEAMGIEVRIAPSLAPPAEETGAARDAA